jgi:hypothetical protein
MNPEHQVKPENRTDTLHRRFSYHVRFRKCFRAIGMRMAALKGIPRIHSVLLVTVEQQRLISGAMMWNTCIYSTAKYDDNII